jgi:hypothetical protein
VNAEGEVEEAESKNFGTVTHPDPGIYCISGLSFTPHNVSATVDYNNGGGVPEITATLGQAVGCEEAGNQVTVGTLESGEPVDRAFYLTLN